MYFGPVVISLNQNSIIKHTDVKLFQSIYNSHQQIIKTKTYKFKIVVNQSICIIKIKKEIELFKNKIKMYNI